MVETASGGINEITQSLRASPSSSNGSLRKMQQGLGHANGVDGGGKTTLIKEHTRERIRTHIHSTHTRIPVLTHIIHIDEFRPCKHTRTNQQQRQLSTHSYPPPLPHYVYCTGSSRSSTQNVTPREGCSI